MSSWFQWCKYVTVLQQDLSKHLTSGEWVIENEYLQIHIQGETSGRRIIYEDP